MLAALDQGTLRAAGLDVFATEPLPADSPLRLHPRVTALPHAGSATHETRQAMAELATSNLLQALAGERPAAVYRYGRRRRLNAAAAASLICSNNRMPQGPGS